LNRAPFPSIKFLSFRKKIVIPSEAPRRFFFHARSACRDAQSRNLSDVFCYVRAVKTWAQFMSARANAATAESLVAEIISLDETSIAEAIRILAQRDPDLARIVENIGPPPFWKREPGFPTLVYLILEQQVSLASAKASYERLIAVTGTPLHPVALLKLGARALKRIGFSRQKASYCRLLAQSILKKQLDLDAIHQMDDAAARTELLRIKGIGPWTADVYLLTALRRPDAWPVGDLALQKAVRRVKRLRKHPSAAKLEHIGKSWRPYRAVAARLLWHDYLSQPKRSAVKKRTKQPA
jgi:DNA-3-methyladenine glycosylase II